MASSISGRIPWRSGGPGATLTMAGMTAVLCTRSLPAPFAERISAGATPRVLGRLTGAGEQCGVVGDDPPARCAPGSGMRSGARRRRGMPPPLVLADSVHIWEGATPELAEVPR